MSQTRIVIIPPAASMPAPCLVVDDQGRVLQRGSLSLDDPQVRPEMRTVAIAPGADVLIRWLDLPVGGVAQVRVAARWALKDHLAADPDQAVVALGPTPAKASGETPRLVAAVSATLLEAWIDYLGALGVAPQTVVPDSLILPSPSESGGLSAAVFNGDTVLRGEGFAATVQSDLVEAVAAGRPLDWITDRDRLEALISAAALAPSVDLLSARAKPAAARSGNWRLAAGLAAAVILSPLVLLLAGAARDQFAADSAERRMQAVIAESFPDAATASDPFAAVERELAAAPPPGGVVAASAALFAAVEQVEGAELDSLSANSDQGLRATLSYPAFQDLETIRAAMAGAGLFLDDASTVEDGGRIVSEVIVGGAA